MNANITRYGIEADLKWMKRAGIGGFQNFDGGGANVPRVVPPVIYMTPQWKDAFRFAMHTAAGLGLEGARAASAGWSETGGPWVTPPEAMKKYVWSETWIEGGKPFDGRLAQPPQVTGPFQDIPTGGQRDKPLPEFYADARVFAYRAPEGADAQTPKVTASALAGPADLTPIPALDQGFPGEPVMPDPPPPPPPVGPDQVRDGPGQPLELALISDGRLQQVVDLARTRNTDPTWVRFEYARPVTVTGLTVSTGGVGRKFGPPSSVFPGFGEPDGGPRLRVEASDDGRAWRAVAEDFYNGAQRTIAIPATTARAFRIVFLEARTPPRIFKFEPRVWVPAISLAELRLHTLATVHRFEVKANFANVNDYFAIPSPAAPSGTVVPKADVIDLTGKMHPDGRLDWTPPPGRWVVVRLGYSLTGHENGPAPVEATGLEVDKLNARHVAKYMDTYLGLLTEAAGKANVGQQGLQYLLNDSYEAGFQNWTDDILEQFRARRGYDPSPWLPALTGVAVESPTASDRFLYDFRQTISDLVAEAHYKVVTEKSHAAGLGTYQEAQEDRRAYQGDDMRMRQYADVPMAAMWSFPPDGEPRATYVADDRGAASVANIYGQKYVAAESFTGGSYGTTPNSLKHVADVEWVGGINRFVVHTSAHQPLDRGPGMSLMGIGVFFSRNETWAEMARGWTDYLARGSFLMQQGRAATDIAYFYGQEAPITGIWAFEPQRDVPEGYDWDYVNDDVILHRLSLRNGWLVTPSGMRYRILQMGQRTRQITLPVLQKLRDFVRGGAVIVGDKPTNSPSQADDDATFQRIVGEMWGDGAPGEHRFGAGRVVVGRAPGEVLAGLGLARDFAFIRPRPDTAIWFKHRRLKGGEVYLVVNRDTWAQDVEVSLRAAGKSVELWDAVSGQVRPASYRTEQGRTVVPLKLGGLDSVFLVMRRPGPASRTVAEPQETTLADVDGDWTVAFEPNRGAPSSDRFSRLTSWTEHDDPGVKYFSGVGTYNKVLDAPATWFRPGARQWLDLGQVAELAQVSVNGRDLGVVWRAPYRVDVTGALKPGRNRIAVKVANTWVNRMIGDKQPGAAPVAVSLTNPYAATTPLPKSGLLGPVRVVEVR